MKKRLLTVFALFASLAITSCGGRTGSNTSKSESKSEEPSSVVSSSEAPAESSSEVPQSTSEAPVESSSIEPCSKHTWGDYVVTTPATCTVDGVQTRTCTVCGATQEKAVKAAHTWGEYVETKPATCSEAGKEKRTCSLCGAEDERDIDKLEHAWGEWAARAGATCMERPEERECSACHEKETRGSFIQHDWQVTSTVDADEEGITYDFVKCSKCNKEGLMVSVKKSDNTNNMTVTGSPKTAPTGCVKLGTTNDYMQAVIKLAEAKTGKVYIRGSMDYWYTESNQNEQKGIYNGKDGGAADKANGKANFTFKVGPDAENLTEVELTADKDLLYKDWFPETVGFSGVSSTDWSTIGDIEVGNISLQAGLNTLRFTRVDSYNIAVSAFVVVFEAAA